MTHDYTLTLADIKKLFHDKDADKHQAAELDGLFREKAESLCAHFGRKLSDHERFSIGDVLLNGQMYDVVRFLPCLNIRAAVSLVMPAVHRAQEYAPASERAVLDLLEALDAWVAGSEIDIQPARIAAACAASSQQDDPATSAAIDAAMMEAWKDDLSTVLSLAKSVWSSASKCADAAAENTPVLDQCNKAARDAARDAWASEWASSQRTDDRLLAFWESMNINPAAVLVCRASLPAGSIEDYLQVLDIVRLAPPLFPDAPGADGPFGGARAVRFATNVLLAGTAKP
jgi:hypothetical protein